MGCDNVIFLIEFPADEDYLTKLEQEWSMLKGGEQVRRCLFIRLEQPFHYNALMHERLVDQLVSLLHADGVYRKVHERTEISIPVFFLCV